MSSVFDVSIRTSVFGLRLWFVIAACIVLLILLFLIFFPLCFILRRRRKRKSKRYGSHFSSLGRSFVSRSLPCLYSRAPSLDRRLLSRNASMSNSLEEVVLVADQWSSRASAMETQLIARNQSVVVELRSVNQYALREIQLATNGFSDENLIGSGEFGFFYRGVFLDATRIAVKRLECNRKAEDFVVEAEAIISVRHRNLVKLLGYCAEGAYRLLVYEYLDNDNLHRWIHGWMREVSPLTWASRMNIIQGTAKCLAYIHEDLVPRYIHGRIKSSNVLLDHQLNPKLSDLGIPILAHQYAITSSMEMSGYFAPEDVAARVLDDKSDIYCFGILVMEIISGKNPVEYSGNEVEFYLIDWLKSMVASRRFDSILDPKLPELPPLKEVKRILLIALRCVDPDRNNRPKMGDVIHMLEPRDLLLSDANYLSEESSVHRFPKENQAIA